MTAGIERTTEHVGARGLSSWEDSPLGHQLAMMIQLMVVGQAQKPQPVRREGKPQTYSVVANRDGNYARDTLIHWAKPQHSTSPGFMQVLPTIKRRPSKRRCTGKHGTTWRHSKACSACQGIFSELRKQGHARFPGGAMLYFHPERGTNAAATRSCSSRMCCKFPFLAGWSFA